jgi:hypothetical protein
MLVVLAVIAIVPGTLASVGAWRNAKATNRAVNNVPVGTPPLHERVAKIEAGQDHFREITQRISRQQDLMNRDLGRVVGVIDQWSNRNG